MGKEESEGEKERDRERIIYFKEPAQRIVGAGKFKICKASQRAGDSSKS